MKRIKSVISALKAISVLLVTFCRCSQASIDPYQQSYNQLASNYAFSWSVLDDYTGNDFGHNEKRQGYDTAGSYHVLLPDGRRQTVTYSVDPQSGFQARVDYDGISRSPKAFGLSSTASPPSPSSSHTALATPKPIQQQLHHQTQPLYTRPTYSPPSQPLYTPPVQAPPPVVQHQPSSLPPLPSYFSAQPQPSYHHQPSYPGLEEPLALETYEPKTIFYPAVAPPATPVVNGLSPHFNVPSSVFESPDPHGHPAEPEVKKPDPYLRTEDDLQDLDFDQPFFYSSTKKISGSSRKKKPVAKKHGHTLFYY